ncbi:MAG: arylesterase [Acidobacteria bacterium]|jgi:acyl-CoA thioesterase-1|nr:arylesterase [Acidobacteriota bacterium]
MNRLGLRPPSRIISGNCAWFLGLGLIVGLAGLGCRDASPPADTSATPAPTPTTEAGGEALTSEGSDNRPVILFVGTSLTAGHGLEITESFPAVFQRKLDAAGLGYRVVNAGVSGETSAGALRRIAWLLRQPVAVLVLETGANDGLRGQDPETTRANIQAIFDRARQQEPPPKLALVAMEALPNYGVDYTEEFRAIYPKLAEANDALLIPFLLDGVAGDPELNLADGIHPNAEGQKRVAENVWRSLEPLLVEEP